MSKYTLLTPTSPYRKRERHQHYEPRERSQCMKQQINKVSKLQHCASRLYRIHIFSYCSIVFIHAQLYTDLACLPVKCEAYRAALSHCHSAWFIQYILMPRSCPNYIDLCWMFAYIAVPDHTYFHASTQQVGTCSMHLPS